MAVSTDIRVCLVLRLDKNISATTNQKHVFSGDWSWLLRSDWLAQLSASTVQRLDLRRGSDDCVK